MKKRLISIVILVAIVIMLAAQVFACGDCFMTPGFWKNHTELWQERIDKTFETSGIKWLDALNTAPRGDAYYIMAPKFISAYLNWFVWGGGAEPLGEVADAYYDSKWLLNTFKPGELTGELRERALRNAAILDEWNNQ